MSEPHHRPRTTQIAAPECSTTSWACCLSRSVLSPCSLLGRASALAAGVAGASALGLTRKVQTFEKDTSRDNACACALSI
jgi:hypothetical protein